MRHSDGSLQSQHKCLDRQGCRWYPGGMRDTEEDVLTETPERSAIAENISDLKDTILRLARDRERLPQPLFWSLFNSRLKDIKKTKEQERLLRESLGIGVDL